MTLAPFLREKAEAAAQKAITEGLQIVALGDGLMLVREDSPEGKSRLAQQGVVAERLEINGKPFLVCNA